MRCIFVSGNARIMYMKNVFLHFVTITILVACTKVLNTIAWKNPDTVIAYYSDSIKYPSTVSFSEHINALLYTSYIYLSDGETQDITRGNELLTRAMVAMDSDCVDNHGTYDNFCYFGLKYFPSEFKSLNDAMFLYQMALPCVHVEMILENPDAIDLIAPYFGSTRDANIPTLCAPFDLFGVTGIDVFTSTPGYDKIQIIDGFEPISGTMRVGLSRLRYYNMAKMLLLPHMVFTDINKTDSDMCATTINNKKICWRDIVQIINSDSVLLSAFNMMQNRIAAHYIDFLGLDKDTAILYANMSAVQIVMDSVYVR